jgi:hypothetical protein
MSKSEKDLDPQVRKIIASGEIKFDYIKSNHFRVLHVDGAIGGIAPKLNIRMAVFNERSAIPQETVQRVSQEGRIGEEIVEKRIGRNAIVREVEADLVMDLATSKTIISWLQDKVDQLEAIIKSGDNKGEA